MDEASGVGGVWWRRPAVLAAALLCPACGLTLRTDIHDPDPASKIPALVAATADPTAEELAAMVDALDHDDVAVRLFAIESLERATGQNRGFRPYDPPEQRRAAFERWRAWLGERQGDIAAGGPPRSAGRTSTGQEEASHGGGR